MRVKTAALLAAGALFAGCLPFRWTARDNGDASRDAVSETAESAIPDSVVSDGAGEVFESGDTPQDDGVDATDVINVIDATDVIDASVADTRDAHDEAPPFEAGETGSSCIDRYLPVRGPVGDAGVSDGGTADAGACGAVDLRTSREHCGRCGNACASDQACVAGRCAMDVQLATGEGHVCARVHGRVFCWGRVWERPDGPTGNALTPVEYTALGSNVTWISAAMTLTCALDSTRQAYCWGLQGLGSQTGALEFDAVLTGQDRFEVTRIAAFDRSDRIDLGYYQNGFLVRDGALFAFGRDTSSGRLGRGRASMPFESKPPALTGTLIDQPRGAFGEFEASGAYDQNGVLYTWGMGTNRRNGITVDRNVPMTLSVGSEHVDSGAARSGFSCVSTREGHAWCWGEFGTNVPALGRGVTPTDPTTGYAPGLVLTAAAPRNTSLSDVVQVSVGWRIGCAVTRDGAVYCWGKNSDGAMNGTLGTESPSEYVTLASRVQGLPSDDPVASVSASGSDMVCAATFSGRVYCWGRNTNGELGQGDRETRTRPVRVTLPGVCD